MVLHAWWGLNDFFKGFCDRLAEQGFIVLAPDLYNGKTASTIDEAERLSSKMDSVVVEKELIGALEYLRARTKQSGRGIGTVGFSLGAYWALWLATERPDDIVATVLFYGTGRLGRFDQAKSKFLGHFAEKDPYEQLDYIRKLEENLRSADKTVSFHIYPTTGHWFFESDRADAYNEKAAGLAWDRTLKFLRDELK